MNASTAIWRHLLHNVSARQDCDNLKRVSNGNQQQLRQYSSVCQQKRPRSFAVHFHVRTDEDVLHQGMGEGRLLLLQRSYSFSKHLKASIVCVQRRLCAYQCILSVVSLSDDANKKDRSSTPPRYSNCPFSGSPTWVTCNPTKKHH